MRAPQIIWIAVVAANLGVVLAKHGEPREPYNFWISVLGWVFMAGILFMGGFFNDPH